MNIFHIHFSNTTKESIIKNTIDSLQKKEKIITVCTPNPEILLYCRKNPDQEKILNSYSYRTPDGIGLYIGAQMLKYEGKIARFFLLPLFFYRLFFRRKYLYEKYGQRICGSTLSLELLKKLNEEKFFKTIAILDKEVSHIRNKKDAEKKEFQKNTEKMLQEKFPNLTFQMYFWDEKKQNASQDFWKNVAIIFSTLGFPLQEKYGSEIEKKYPHIWAYLAIGGSIDFITGFQKRAPKIFQTLGIEWLYRLLKNPKRRYKRILQALFIFPMTVLFFRNREQRDHN